jgi:hypothetical protein
MSPSTSTATTPSPGRTGVVKGSGTADDPYIIEGWIIDTRSHDYGIYIDGDPR